MGQAAVSGMAWQNANTLHKNSLHFHTLQLMKLLSTGINEFGLSSNVTVNAASWIGIALAGDGEILFYHRKVVDYIQSIIEPRISHREFEEINESIAGSIAGIGPAGQEFQQGQDLTYRFDIIYRLVMIYEGLKPHLKNNPKAFDLFFAQIIHPLPRALQIPAFFLFMQFIRQTRLVDRMQYRIRSPGVLELRFVMPRTIQRPSAGG